MNSPTEQVAIKAEPHGRRALASFLSSSTVKGALVGGVSAALVTTMLSSVKPATASATVLLGPLATIEGMIDQYMGVMNDYVDQWIADITGLVSDSALISATQRSEDIYGAITGSSRDSALRHITGGGSYRGEMSDQLSILRDGAGGFDAGSVAKYLAPPGPISIDSLNEGMEAAWEHALLITGDEPIPEVRDSQRDTLAGTEYEYKRLQTIQGRLLAQDSIQRYPLEGPKLEGYRKHLEQYQDGGKTAGMTPGQLMAAQLDVAVKVQASSAVDQLESSLRQERMLGALLAQEVKPEAGQLRSERP